MPFSFIDIEAKKSRNIYILFMTLVFFYFAGAFLLFLLTRLSLFLEFGGRARSLPGNRTLLIFMTAAFFLALIHWIFSTWNMIERLLNVIGAQPADPEDLYHHTLKNIVDEVSVASGGRKLETWIIGARYLNAFAISDRSGRSVIGVTEGLLDKLNRRQMEAVVAHEAAHILHGDALLISLSCSMAAVYAAMLRMVLSGWREESRTLYPRRTGFQPVAILLVAIIALMRLLTLILNTWISREGELRADATAVRLTRDSLALAEALHVISGGWRGSSLPAENVASIFIINPRRWEMDDRLGLLADRFSTHPPVKKRVAILLDMGHIDHKTMVAGIKARPRVMEATPMSQPERQKIWNIMKDGAWTGPFSLVELSQLEWLDPRMWISREGEGRIAEAHEFPEINRLFKKTPSAAQIQACPICGSGLEKVFNEGVTLWRCRSCGGKLLRRRHLSRILVREEMSFSPEVEEAGRQVLSSGLRQKGRYVKVTPPSLVCPCCGRVMKRTFYQAILPYRMEIDICPSCELIWFDNNEMEIVQYLTENFSGPYRL